MSSLLPEALAEKYETELGETKRGKVDEDYDPVSEFQQVLRQDEGAHSADDQIENEVV